MNQWHIPNWMENEIRKRDKSCVYCGVAFTPNRVNRKTAVSWEHIVNDARIVTLKNICLCCISCNASKGAKDLLAWFNSAYCEDKGINQNTVSKVVKDAIKDPPVFKEN